MIIDPRRGTDTVRESYITDLMKERDEKKTCLLHDIKTLYNYIVGKLNV